MWSKLIDLLKQIIGNLPLTLSDSTEPTDVSWNRITMTIEFVLIIVMSPPILVVTLVYFPQYFENLMRIWLPMLTAYGLHLTTNAFKKK